MLLRQEWDAILGLELGIGAFLWFVSLSNAQHLLRGEHDNMRSYLGVFL